MNIGSLIKKVQEVAKLPRVKIAMSGGEQAKFLYKFFTQGHPRMPLLANKRYGAALIPMPPSLDEFLKGKARQALRTSRNKCQKLGYSVAEFPAADRLDEIMAINGSMEVRQDIPIMPDYLDRDRVAAFNKANPTAWGCFDAAGTLRAYCFMVDCGDVTVVSRLMGHGEHIEAGVMYFLLSEMIGAYAKRTPRPSWIMYDMYFGAKPGLRYFKDRMGFTPHNVKWIWQ